MLSKDGYTKIENFMTIKAGVLVLEQSKLAYGENI